jgi:tellurite methyltransferase
MINLSQCAQMDIYLIDQILKNRIFAGQSVCDVGCGAGRNVLPLLALGCEVSGFDAHPPALDRLQRALPPEVPPSRFVQGCLPEVPFVPQSFDVVVCNAVLHFAPNTHDFHAWADAVWSLLKPGGLFFARLSTQIAWPEGVEECFPYIASERDLLEAEIRWSAIRVDPLKTTRVENLRTMSTWVLQAPV